MKKNWLFVGALICVEVILLLLTISQLHIFISNLNFYYNHAPHLYEDLTSFYQLFVLHLIFSILGVLANFLNITIIVLLSINFFPVFRPLVDKLQAKRAARKSKRAEQAEIAKQKRISKLQAELDELKKDE